MPYLIAEVSGLDSSVIVHWSIDISFTPDKQAPQVFSASTDEPGTGAFNINGELGPNDFYGGDAIISCDFCGLHSQFAFRILGTNPSFTSISTALQDDGIRTLLWQESKFRQFRDHVRRPEGGAIDTPLNQGFDEHPPDLTGDGGVDVFDQIILDNNIFNFIGSVHP